MITEIQKQAMALQDAIYAQKYYIPLYEKALAKHGMTDMAINQSWHTDKQLVSMANTFWFALPDSPVIRKEPFFMLWAIAEHCFDEAPE